MNMWFPTIFDILTSQISDDPRDTLEAVITDVNQALDLYSLKVKQHSCLRLCVVS